MRNFISSRILAFRYAFQGWGYVIRTQRNAWIHALFSMVAILLSFWLKIDTIEWVAIIFTIALVWTAEFLNTALEAVVDLASPQQNNLAKVGKDVGAAAVLISAFSSLVIGMLILGPPLWAKVIQYLQPGG